MEFGETKKLKQLWIPLFLLALASCLYFNSLTNPFVYDDFYYVVSNPFVHNLKFLWANIADPNTHTVMPDPAGYRGLTSFFRTLCWVAGSGATWPFHLQKILMHALIAWCLYLITLKLLARSKPLYGETSKLFTCKGRSIPLTNRVVALTGAILFIVHPGLSETMNYISSTSTLQTAFFYILAVWAFVEADSRPVGQKSRFWVFTFIFFILAIMSKEEGITLPVTLLTYCWITRDRDAGAGARRRWKKQTWIAVATFAPLLVYALVYVSLNAQSAALSEERISRYDYLLTQLSAWTHYLGWVFYPFGYAIEHLSYGVNHSLWDERVLFGLLVAITLCLAAYFFKAGKRQPLVAFCLLNYLIPFVPASSIFPLSEPINEHRYYLSYAFLFPLLAYAAWSGLWWLGRRLRRPDLSWLMPLLVLPLLFLAYRTFAEAGNWRTPERVWERAVEVDPENGRARMNLGVILLGQGKLARALSLFDDCARLFDTYPYCEINRCIALAGLGRLTEAQSAIDRAVQLDPELVTTRQYYAKYLLDYTTRYDQALREARTCTRLSGGKNVDCRIYEAEALRKLGRASQAVAVLQATDANFPNVYGVRSQLGAAYLDLRDYSRAEEIFSELVSSDPKDAQAWKSLREAATQLHDGELARRCDRALMNLRQ